MDPKFLRKYKVTFADGTSMDVEGRYAAHAWAWAQHCNAEIPVQSLELIKTDETHLEP